MDLQTSRLYTFIDGPREFALYFLEGQRLIHDLALIHPVRGSGFAYFRDVVLSIQPLIALIKHGEQLGFYIDSASPQFQLKIETSHSGATRCMILPEDFAQFPEAMRGKVRVLKLYPSHHPYESILEIDGLALRELVNRVLQESYQVNSVVEVSRDSDQSVMLHQLPSHDPDEYDYSMASTRARRDELREQLGGVFRRALQEPAEIRDAFAALGFRLLASRPVAFQCNCARERVLTSLRTVYRQQGDSLFEPDRETLEVKCEYCKTGYEVSRTELQQPDRSIH